MSMHRLRISRWPVPSVRLRVKSLKESGAMELVYFMQFYFFQILEYILHEYHAEYGWLVNKWVQNIRIYEIKDFVIDESAYTEIQTFNFHFPKRPFMFTSIDPCCKKIAELQWKFSEISIFWQPIIISGDQLIWFVY